MIYFTGLLLRTGQTKLWENMHIWTWNNTTHFHKLLTYFRPKSAEIWYFETFWKHFQECHSHFRSCSPVHTSIKCYLYIHTTLMSGLRQFGTNICTTIPQLSFKLSHGRSVHLVGHSVCCLWDTRFSADCCSPNSFSSPWGFMCWMNKMCFSFGLSSTWAPNVYKDRNTRVQLLLDCSPVWIRTRMPVLTRTHSLNKDILIETVTDSPKLHWHYSCPLFSDVWF